MLRMAALLALFVLQASILPGQKGPPAPLYPPGTTDIELEGLAVTLRVPEGLTRKEPGSLVVLLHGLGGRGKRLMTLLHDWEQQNYLICAPQATGRGWNAADLEAVEKIALHLLKNMPMDPDRVHVMGFSNGGWNLPALAFSDKLKPVSAVYIGAGFQGARPPKWAAKRQGVLAVAGADDPNARAALATPGLLEKKVRRVEARLQPNLGHRWPQKLNPYMLWWMGVQEGRFQYGQSLVFDWVADSGDRAELIARSVEAMKKKKKGGFLVYVYDSRRSDQMSQARAIEQGAFFDPHVRFYVKQLTAIEVDLALAPSPIAEVTTTPAVAILSRRGKLKKLFKGKVSAKSLRRALKPLVPVSRMPGHRR